MRLTLLRLVCVASAAFALASCHETATPNASGAKSQEAALAGGGASAVRVAGPRIATVGDPDRTHTGQPAPAIALATGPDGGTTTIAGIAAANPGKKILVNLWATWCAPCLEELPTLDRLQAQEKARLVVVPISQDLEGWRAVEKAFTRERYPHLSTLLETKMQFGTLVRAEGLPLTILYDSRGREIWRVAGGLDWTSTAARQMLGL